MTKTIQLRAPGRTRRPVLFEDADAVVAKLKASPGKWSDPDSGWYLIAGGDRTRLGVISQTSYRIRNGKIAAFADPGKGEFDTWVSTDQSVPNRKHDVELYARWLPTKKK